MSRSPSRVEITHQGIARAIADAVRVWQPERGVAVAVKNRHRTGLQVGRDQIENEVAVHVGRSEVVPGLVRDVGPREAEPPPAGIDENRDLAGVLVHGGHVGVAIAVEIPRQ